MDFKEIEAISTYKFNKQKYLIAFLCNYLKIDVSEVDEISIHEFIDKNKEVESAYSALARCRDSWVDDSKGLESMLLGDVTDVIFMTTGIKIDWEQIKTMPKRL